MTHPSFIFQSEKRAMGEGNYQKSNKSVLIGSLWSMQASNSFNPRELSFTKWGGGGGGILPHIYKDELPLLQKSLWLQIDSPGSWSWDTPSFQGLTLYWDSWGLCCSPTKRDWNGAHTEMWSGIQPATSQGRNNPVQFVPPTIFILTYCGCKETLVSQAVLANFLNRKKVFQVVTRAPFSLSSHELEQPNCI